MSKPPLTPGQQQRQAEDIATVWRLTKCPPGLLDPATGFMHPTSIELIREYLSQHYDLNTLMLDTLEKAAEVFGQAIKALSGKLFWFHSKPKPPKPPPKPEAPLQIWDKRRVNREYHEGQEKLRQEAQKAIDRALKKQQKAEADERPKPVFYPDGHRFSGRINWAETKKLQDAWDAQHFNF